MMKRIIIPVLAITLSFNNCIGQSENGDENKQSQKNSPVTNYKVNKEYDEKGNIIRYDSTYSYYYSNVGGDTLTQDSILDVFKQNFNQRFLFSGDPFFNDFFFQDTLPPFNFYHDDFFSNHFKNNMEELDRLMKEMDIFKNEFFNRQFQGPGLNIPSEPAIPEEPSEPKKTKKSKQPVYSL